MTREEIIAGFHKLYLENIAKETAKRGKLRGIPVERLKEIHNETIADYVEEMLRAKYQGFSKLVQIEKESRRMEIAK